MGWLFETLRQKLGIVRVEHELGSLKAIQLTFRERDAEADARLARRTEEVFGQNKRMVELAAAAFALQEREAASAAHLHRRSEEIVGQGLHIAELVSAVQARLAAIDGSADRRFEALAEHSRSFVDAVMARQESFLQQSHGAQQELAREIAQLRESRPADLVKSAQRSTDALTSLIDVVQRDLLSQIAQLRESRKRELAEVAQTILRDGKQSADALSRTLVQVRGDIVDSLSELRRTFVEELAQSSEALLSGGQRSSEVIAAATERLQTDLSSEIANLRERLIQELTRAVGDLSSSGERMDEGLKRALVDLHSSVSRDILAAFDDAAGARTDGERRLLEQLEKLGSETTSGLASLQSSLSDGLAEATGRTTVDLVATTDRLETVIQQELEGLLAAVGRDLAALSTGPSGPEDLLVAMQRFLTHQQGLTESRLLAIEAVISAHLESRDKADKLATDWMRTTGRIVGDIRQKDLRAILSMLDGFDHRLRSDLRARAAYSNDREARQAHFLRESAELLDRLGRRLRPARGAGASEAEQAERRSLAGSDDAATPNRENRAFGLRGISIDPELQGLLSLGAWTQNDTVSEVALASMTRPAIRALFPPEREQIRTIPLQSGLDLQADMRDIFAATAALGWLQEAEDFELFMSLVEPGATVIDVGANFGLYAIHAALYAGAKGKIFAFEPLPGAFSLLQTNVRKNGLEANCTCIRAAVGAESGKADFFVAADSAFSGLSDTGRSPVVDRIATEVVSLDTVPRLKRQSKVNLLKIDVEGSEGAVLAGARALIRRSADPLIMLEYSHKNLTEERRAALIGELRALVDTGFEVQVRSAEDGLLGAIAPEDLEGARSENLFLSRPGGSVRRRLDASASKMARRSVTPEQAAALFLLRQQANHRNANLPDA